jgi:flagellar hook assembly protein FlgD
MSGGNNGLVIAAGDHASSELYNRITLAESANGDMPPTGSLSQTDIDLIAQWIDEGALETPAVDSENLFFSEYIEGSSNNKVLEIYNPTGAAVDLSEYTVQQSNNGAGWGMDDGPPVVVEPGFTLQLSGTLASGEVYVLAADAASGLFLAQADVALGYPSVCHFNGDDAVGLFNNDVLIDVIGIPSEEGAWDVAGITNATGEHTLIRKSTVTTGNTDWAVSAGTSTNDSEWIVEEQDYVTNLGFHVYGSGGENMSPIANAGSNQTVIFGSSVTLDGTASTDPDGTIASYQWAQNSGAIMTLSSITEAIVTFTAPDAVDSLSFTLTVTDNDGATGSENVFVKTAAPVSGKVFFSEYAEGSAENKYLEIYNGTGEDIDLSQYAVSRCSNGCDDESSWDYPFDIMFESGTIVVTGDVYVITHSSASSEILAEQDVTVSYLSNGNDVIGLVDAASGVIIDIIGELGDDPGSGWDVAGVSDATKDHTLVRKSSVETGNSNWATSAGTDASNSEWLVYDQNTWDYLGSHSQSVDAPVVAVNSVSPVFITDATEIELSASVTTPTGSITSVVVKYGTNGQLVNPVELYQDNGEIWAGTIPAQQGNIVLQMRVYATNSEGVEGQSTMVERIIASSTPSAIADLYSSQSINEIVTVKGIITIGGGGLLYPTQTKAYIQDQSGRGLQLFDYELIDGIERGDEIEVVGFSGYYNTTYQIKDFEYRELSSGNALPDPIVVTSEGANSSDYEGTLISITGNVSAVTPVSTTGINLTIDDATSIMIWNSTGIDVVSFVVGYRGQFIGIGSQFNDQYQLLVGYQSDITTVVAVDGDILVADRFILMPAYPNPFNPATKLSFSIDAPSEIRLEIYDVSGKLVDNIANGFYQSGMHVIDWNASDLASGMYFVHLARGSERLTQKVMLLK